MINKKTVLIVVFLLVNAMFVCGRKENFPVLKGSYLGQKPRLAPFSAGQYGRQSEFPIPRIYPLCYSGW